MAQWVLVVELLANLPVPVPNIVFDVGGTWDFATSSHPFEGAEVELQRVEEVLEARYESFKAPLPTVHFRSREARDLSYEEKKALRTCLPVLDAAGHLHIQ